MDELRNRSNNFAELMVTMVWLLLVPGLTGLHVPYYMLILGGSTIITGICPALACFICNNKRAIDVAAPISAAIFLSLASSIAILTVSEVIVVCVATLSVTCTGFRIISYCREKNQHGLLPGTTEFHTILDGSYEFLCCTIAIHFMWLGSLAWEGMVISEGHGVLSKTIGTINIFCCAIGMCTILVEMAPPVLWHEIGDIAGPLFWFDASMIISIGTVLGAAMWKSLVLPGVLLLILAPFIILCPLIAVFVVSRVRWPEYSNNARVTVDPPKLAPLGLTKLMVTGFLFVSFNVNSTKGLIANWFLVFAAAAIVSGLTWRLLTQAQVREMLGNKESIPSTQEPPAQVGETEMSETEAIIPPQELPMQREERGMSESEAIIRTTASQTRRDKTAAIASSAKTACICTHICVVTATVLFMIDQYVKYPASAAVAPVPTPPCT